MRANCTVDLDLDLECWRILGHIIAAGGGGETMWTFYCMLCCIVVLQSSGQLDTPKKYHCIALESPETAKSGQKLTGRPILPSMATCHSF